MLKVTVASRAAPKVRRHDRRAVDTGSLRATCAIQEAPGGGGVSGTKEVGSRHGIVDSCRKID